MAVSNPDPLPAFATAFSPAPSRITIDPRWCSGRPCIRGLRVRVSDVLDLLAAGLTRQEILDRLPELESADIEAALRFASKRLSFSY